MSSTNASSVAGQFELQLPTGFAAMKNQVAGHTFDTTSAGLLQDSRGCVLKPLGKPECGESELKFYEALQSIGKSSDANSLLLSLRSFVPEYHKIVNLMVNKRQITFLQMEDLTHGMRKPCIMDIKIGRRTWDPKASDEKRRVEEEKYIRCKQVLGLCVPGFQVYTRSEGTVLRFNKEYGKRLDADGFRATIALFLNAQNSEVYKPLVNEILKQLYNIFNWFKVQTIYHFYASSLLILYDFETLQEQLEENNCSLLRNGFPQLVNGNVRNRDSTDNIFEQNSADNESRIVKWVKVKMIDFAHVFPAEGQSPDTNYIFGLKHLINQFEELLER